MTASLQSREVSSKDTNVYAYYPLLNSSSCMCGSWSLNRSPLTEEPLNQAAYHLSSREKGSILHCLCGLHEVDQGKFALTLSPGHAVIMSNILCSIREVKKTSKAHILIMYAPQFIAYIWVYQQTSATTRCTRGSDTSVPTLLPSIRSVFGKR